MQSQKPSLKLLFQTPVIVAALGYFVDIYDLLLFGIVRKPSLESLGVQPDQILSQGLYLLNIQMAGLVIGGLLWGILGDKKGRISVLFGSILLYSLANIANAFVTSVDQYALCRIIAGIGLAGELGAGITLVAEILPKEIRGFGTSLVAGLGLLGAVLANIVAENFDWHTAYIIGGVLGLLLLLMRFKMFESGMFKNAVDDGISRGDFLSLFKDKIRFTKYLRCILIGVPIWFVIGFLVTFSPEYGAAMGIDGVKAGKAIMFAYIGLSSGDIISGILSQWLKSRRKVIFVFMLLSISSMAYYLLGGLNSLTQLYSVCFLLGFSIGYWALFVTVAAEQFGTNLRATVATTVPNFVRGTTILDAYLFNPAKTQFGILTGSMYVGLLLFGIALVALWFMEDTFHKDLDYLEEN
jgi:MFS family permease